MGKIFYIKNQTWNFLKKSNRNRKLKIVIRVRNKVMLNLSLKRLKYHREENQCIR